MAIQRCSWKPDVLPADQFMCFGTTRWIVYWRTMCCEQSCYSIGGILRSSTGLRNFCARAILWAATAYYFRLRGIGKNIPNWLPISINNRNWFLVSLARCLASRVHLPCLYRGWSSPLRLAPPWFKHLPPQPLTKGAFLHGVPFRVRAPQLTMHPL